MSEVEAVRYAALTEIDKRIDELKKAKERIENSLKEVPKSRSASTYLLLEHGSQKFDGTRLTAPPPQDPKVAASHTEKMVDPYERPPSEWRRGRILELEAERNEAIRQRDEAWERIKVLDPCRTACSAKSRLKNEIPALKNKLRSAEDSSRDYRISRDEAWERVKEMRLIIKAILPFAESSRNLDCWGCGSGLEGIHSSTCEAGKNQRFLTMLKVRLDNV